MPNNDRDVLFKNIEASVADPLEILYPKIAPSVISFALESRNGRSRTLLGTGFGVEVGPEEKTTDVFVTCSHIFDGIKNAKKRGKSLPKKRLVAYLKDDRYVWQEIKSLRFGEPESSSEDGFVRPFDISICPIPEIRVPPLKLSQDMYIAGKEVGILGFPNYEYLQAISTQPFLLKSIISGRLFYPLESPDGGSNDLKRFERLAIGCTVGEGFSGSPVFSLRDGNVVGMIDRTPLENSRWVFKTKKPRRASKRINEYEIYAEYPAGISFAIPSVRIQEVIDSLKKDRGNS